MPDELPDVVTVRGLNGVWRKAAVVEATAESVCVVFDAENEVEYVPRAAISSRLRSCPHPEDEEHGLGGTEDQRDTK